MIQPPTVLRSSSPILSHQAHRGASIAVCPMGSAYSRESHFVGMELSFKDSVCLEDMPVYLGFDSIPEDEAAGGRLRMSAELLEPLGTCVAPDDDGTSLCRLRISRKTFRACMG